MGDKIESKKLAGAAGCELHSRVSTMRLKQPRQRVEIAKAHRLPRDDQGQSAGGGGKGLRVAFNDKEASGGLHLLPQ
jgi:acetyl/propionyl-CoA carboxylase alpha subunit